MSATAEGPGPLLFTPISLRGITSRNRIVVPPMCQYSAENGYPTDWHFAHLSHFAMGGAGIVFTEASAVESRGRITHGDLGIWEDGQAEALKRIASFLKQQGAVPGVQLAHAGRKASMQRPWEGNGPLDARDAVRGEHPWDIVGASANPVGPGWLIPHHLTKAEIADIVNAFARAARRADSAGFEAIEIHGAHGYLVHTFLSPLANLREDEYGGERGNRMRFALEVAAAVRSAWPAQKPLFFRISAVDWEEGGWAIEDSVVLAKALKAEGVDVIDCSSGGIAGPATAATAPRHPGFQVPFAERIALEADVRTQAVGLIMEGRLAEEILQKRQASLIAVARQALFDPFWPIHAAKELGVDTNFESWPHYYGWWLNRRSRVLTK